MASAVANLALVAANRANNDRRFNAEAAAWDAQPMVRAASQEALKAILARFQALGTDTSHLDILEIGCGTGVLSSLLAPHVKSIVAVDAAEGMIDVLKQKIAKTEAPRNILPLSLLLEDPEDPALPPEEPNKTDGPRRKFDTITSQLVLHHIPDLEFVLRTMYGCLKPGGCVALTDFEDFGPEAKRFHPRSRMDGVARHGINVKEMTALMKLVGFVNVNASPQWTMSKSVERFEGEFGESSKADTPDKGEFMEFPFVLCYGKKP